MSIANRNVQLIPINVLFGVFIRQAIPAGLLSNQGNTENTFQNANDEMDNGTEEKHESL